VQDRLLTMQIAAPPVGTCPGAVERLRADHEPRDGDVAGPRGQSVAWVARSVHEIPVRVRPPHAAVVSTGSSAARRTNPVTAALPPRIHAVRDELT